jgi:hypothetical protein
VITQIPPMCSLALQLRAVGGHAAGSHDGGAAGGVQAASEHPRAALAQLLVEPVLSVVIRAMVSAPGTPPSGW